MFNVFLNFPNFKKKKKSQKYVFKITSIFSNLLLFFFKCVAFATVASNNVKLPRILCTF